MKCNDHCNFSSSAYSPWSITRDKDSGANGLLRRWGMQGRKERKRPKEETWPSLRVSSLLVLGSSGSSGV